MNPLLQYATPNQAFIGEGGKYHTFYVIKNDLGKREYFGKHSTTCLEDSYLGGGTRIIYAVKKYGKEHFWRVDLEFFSTSEAAFKREGELITLELVESDGVLNLKAGGEITGAFSEEAKEKIRIATLASMTPERLTQMREISLRQKPITDATREKIRTAATGRFYSEATRAKIKAAQVGRPPMTAKNKAAMSERLKLRMQCPIYREKIAVGRAKKRQLVTEAQHAQ